MKNKNYNMELIRTVSFVMVIIIHVTNYYCRALTNIKTGEYLFSLTLDVVSRVSVPCFFMLSGALLLGREESLKKNGSRLFRFLAVLVFWSIVYYFFNVYYMGTDVDLKEILFVPAEPHLWYLYATIPIYFVLPFFQVMCRGMDEKLDRAFLAMASIAGVFLYFSSLIQEEAYYDVPIIGDRIYTFYFFMGYFILKYEKRITWSSRRLFLIFIGSTALNVILTAFISYVSGDHFERLMEYGCPLVAISGLSFFTWIIRMGKGRIEFGPRAKRWIDTWCRCSFGIYLIHILFLDNFKKYVKPWDLTAWAAVPLLTAGILGVSFLCIYLLQKLPFGKYIS
jgi:surface polysaccharide O-acyltransferase-like enzyme